jgi:hypothetical protein
MDSIDGGVLHALIRVARACIVLRWSWPQAIQASSILGYGGLMMYRLWCNIRTDHLMQGRVWGWGLGGWRVTRRRYV